MSAKNIAILFGIFAAAIFLSFVAIFFFTLNTAVSDFSGGDAAISNQIYYNFLHGRLFQLSTYLEEYTQFYNPRPYFNVLVLHGYILGTVIVSLFYVPWPGINTMYAVFIILNYVGFAFFTFKIIQRLSPSNAGLKSLLAFSVFLLSGYLRQAVLCGYPIALCGPFILGAYYFLISEKRAAFFFTIISLCLIQEDLALFAVTFLIVLLIFEKKCKKTIYLSLAFSLGYFILWNFIIQPVLRRDLILVDPGLSSMLSVRFHEMLKTLSLWKPDPQKWLVTFSAFYLPILASALIYKFFGSARRMPWIKLFSFLFLAPAAHWLYGNFNLSGVHSLPVLPMAYLSFLLFLGYVNFNWKKNMTPGSTAVFFAAIGIFLAVNIVAMTPALPFSPRIYAWKAVKKLTGLEIFKRDEMEKKIAKDDEWRKQAFSNKEAIKIVRDIPKDKSVVFWGNYPATGFMTARNDFWFFPMYYDLADFLVIQKDAKYTGFTAEDLNAFDYRKPGFWGRELYTNTVLKAVSDQLVKEIIEKLVNKQHTHRITRDTKYVLVLERLVKYRFDMPKSSLGLGQ